MGNGYYSPSTQTFNLYVSFRYDATSQLTRWQTWFTWASEMLDMATDGRFRIGRVVYVNNETATDVLGADIRISLGNWAHTKDLDGFGVSGSIMTIGDLNLGQPGLLVHELGHYAFGLWDENAGPGGATTCVNDDDDTYTCVMQRSRNSIQLPVGAPPRWHPSNVVTEFCSDRHPTFPHRTSEPKTWQQHHKGESCWQTIDKITKYGTVDRPPGAPVTTGTIPNPVPVPMVPAVADGRYVLVLDRSGSMSTNDAIDGVRYAAHFWVDLEEMLGNQIGVVSYSSSPDPTLALGPLPRPGVSLAQAHALVDTALVSPGGSTNIRSALDFAQNLFTAPQTGQTILAFTDGRHNVGPDPSPTAIGMWDTVVHTVTFGAHAQRGLMQQIALAADGLHRHVPNPADASHSAFRINRELSIIATTEHSDMIAARDAGLLPAREGGHAPPVDEPGSPDDLEFVAGLSPEEVAERGDMVELEVDVEEGTVQVTFAANFRGEDRMFLYVLDPDGVPLEPAPAQFAAGEAHASYSVVPRRFGTWRMRLRRLDLDGPRSVPVYLFAFAANPDLTVAVFGTQQLYEVGEPVTVRAVAHYPGTLTNLHIRAWPEGSPDEARTFSEMGEGIGQYTLDLDPFDRPDSYPYVFEFVADDDTIEAIRSPDEEEDETIPPRRRTGPWVRRVDAQIHVGPLPEGEDTDGDELGTGCCASLVRWLLRVCRLGDRTYRQAKARVQQRTTG